ncbi:DUF4190 domain-containing protein [Dactylosporangium sp. NPDC048998]|uniref:DUF4190 domain-containing protein n=1 Tax=Dactylosporangium sp. NPDC048998 TaxID=3363976 RepID=UPI003717E0D6
MDEPQPDQPRPEQLPPQPGWQPPPAMYYPAPPTNTYAILAAIFAFVVLPPLGIYFGYKARAQIAQTGERGSELATVGIVGGWILTVIQGAVLIIWCGFAIFFIGGGIMSSR